jgi:uncharacterized protein YndB with AHSA1/START domain
MNCAYSWPSNPELDLVLERVIDVPVELVWKAWTEPEHLKAWYCPRPWSVSDCELDLRPGGIFSATMRSPEGQEFVNLGCYLDIVPKERIIWTDALQPGYRPAEKGILGDLFLTAIITMIPEGTGTRYKAVAMHHNAENRKRHEEMGFHEGWSTCLDQLVEHMKAVAG